MTEKIEIIIPVCNEEECIPKVMQRLLHLKNHMLNNDFVFTFVDDGSKDQSVGLLKKYSQQYSFVHLIVLSRNFGHQMAVTAGLDHADADYVAIIDADLQDPPELIEPMVQKAKEGYDIVYGKRRVRKGETWFKKMSASLFYRLLTQMCDLSIPRNTGDFRLISRRVLKVVREMREVHRFLRGIIPWTGFQSFAFEYQREERQGGVSKYPFKKMVKLAIDALFSFSMSPLRFMTYVGLGIVGFSACVAFFMIYLRFFTPYTVPGITAVILTVMFLGGLQILMLGVIGEYVGRTFEAAKKRPLYVVKESVNL